MRARTYLSTGTPPLLLRILPGACDSARALSWKTVPRCPPFSMLIHADNRSRLIAEDYRVLATRSECRRYSLERVRASYVRTIRVTHSGHALEEPLRYDETSLSSSLSSSLLSSMSNPLAPFVSLVSFVSLTSFIPFVFFRPLR